uniref:Uncharacterized protein n=1 Tax=Oryza punctata TaxID=4537 RepID=A0A0E0L871_ORYPU
MIDSVRAATPAAIAAADDGTRRGGDDVDDNSGAVGCGLTHELPPVSRIRRPTSPNPPFLLAVVAGAGSARGWAARAGSTRVGAAPGHLLGGDGPSAPATAPVGHHSCRHHPPPRLLAEEDGDQQIGVVEGRRWQIGAGEGGR